MFGLDKKAGVPAPQSGVNVYALFDRVVGEYQAPVTAPNDQTVLRMISDSLKMPSTALATHAGDLAVFRIGHFEQRTGFLSSEDAPQFLVQVSSLLPAVPAVPSL